MQTDAAARNILTRLAMPLVSTDWKKRFLLARSVAKTRIERLFSRLASFRLSASSILLFLLLATGRSAFAQTPSISQVNDNASNGQITSGAVGQILNIIGGNFGSTQGSSTVTFNGTPAGTARFWSATEITVAIPSGATTGSLIVTVGGVASNSFAFTILARPNITVVDDNASNGQITSGAVGQILNIAGGGFGLTQGSSTVTFNGALAGTARFWSAAEISVAIPSGATTGSLVVTVGGVASNSFAFTILARPNITVVTNQATNQVITSGVVGLVVNISGGGFGSTQGSSTVTFNGTPAGTASFWSPAEVSVTIPSGATTGNLLVTVGGVASNAFAFAIVTAAPTITSANSTTFTVGTAGSFTVTATGSPNPTLSEAGPLPDGLTFNASTGVLSGTPAAGTAEIYPIIFRAHNGVNPDAVQNFTLAVNNQAAATVYYYFGDRLETTRTITNSSGVVCYDADLYPYGGERVYTNNCDPDYKFIGKERDEETNLDYLSARYYSSQFGRFVTPDPAGISATCPLNPQTQNRYAYVTDNPVNKTDPTGLCGDGDNSDCGGFGISIPLFPTGGGENPAPETPHPIFTFEFPLNAAPEPAPAVLTCKKVFGNHRGGLGCAYLCYGSGGINGQLTYVHCGADRPLVSQPCPDEVHTIDGYIDPDEFCGPAPGKKH